MFKAELLQWEFWNPETKRWPVRGDGVSYPKGQPRVIQKETPAVPYRQAWAVDGVLERLRKAKMKPTLSYSTKWLTRGEAWNGGAPFTVLDKFAVIVTITADTPRPKKRRKKYVKPYTHPHDGLPHNVNGHLAPCDCWGCKNGSKYHG
jgi:hypothetical protein